MTDTTESKEKFNLSRWALDHPELTMRFNNQGVPGWEDRATKVGWPLAKRFIGHALDVGR